MGLEVQECCFQSLILSGPPSLPLSFFFLSLFFFLPSGVVPYMPSSRSGYCFPFVPPPPLSPASLVYIPLPLFGDLKAPLLPSHPPSLLCGVQTLSPPLQRKKAAPTFLELSLDLTPTIICPVESHVRPRVSELPRVRFGFCFSWGRPPCLPGGSGKGKSSLFFFFFYLETDWREERHR